MEKYYDRAALIQAYLATKEPYGHEDIKRFNAERLVALERAFDVQLDREGIKKREHSVLWMLFKATVESYLSIRTPGSDFLDGSLIVRHVDTLGEHGAVLMTDWQRIISAAADSEKAHRSMLDELFKLLWGDITTVVTSEQLRRLGFDDAQEPNWVDYA